VVIPVLGIPILNHPDLLRACIASIDHPVGRLIVVDNSPEGEMAEVALEAAPDLVAEVFVTEPPDNLGYGASANLVYRTNAQAEWWAFANSDVEFAPGDLGRLAKAMEPPPLMVGTTNDPRFVGIHDFRIFGVNHAFLSEVGFFDENFHPAYCEDVDLRYRARLAGVPTHFLDGATTHIGSVCYQRDARYVHQNSRSYPRNVAYYQAKWGGPMGRERFETPFDRGGSVADWARDIGRIRDNAWR
jgi:GT2 family glycosyltransferase